MMLWKETQVVWSTYYVLLRTSASETLLTFLTETRLQDCHLLIGHCECERGGGAVSSGVLVQRQNLLSR